MQTEVVVGDAEWIKMKKDMCAILVDKCEGDALLLVKNEKRDGLMSFMRLNKFFTETSGRGMADRRRAVMRPDKSTKEEDIFRNVEKWEEEVRDLERLTGETVLSEGFKKTAIKEICCGRVEQEVDFREMTSS